MITIQDEQARRMGKVERVRFINQVVDHIQRCFAQYVIDLPQKDIADFVDSGIKRAARHGFIGERDVCKFIDLMIVFGPEFDEHPDCAWAKGPLAAVDVLSAADRMDRLCRLAKHRLLGSVG